MFPIVPLGIYEEIIQRLLKYRYIREVQGEK